jgi:hypothetical protein
MKPECATHPCLNLPHIVRNAAMTTCRRGRDALHELVAEYASVFPFGKREPPTANQRRAVGVVGQVGIALVVIVTSRSETYRTGGTRLPARADGARFRRVQIVFPRFGYAFSVSAGHVCKLAFRSICPCPHNIRLHAPPRCAAPSLRSGNQTFGQETPKVG